jgi:hypothetical protein
MALALAAPGVEEDRLEVTETSEIPASGGRLWSLSTTFRTREPPTSTNRDITFVRGVSWQNQKERLKVTAGVVLPTPSG